MKDISKVGVLTQRLVVSGYSEFARCIIDSNLFPALVSHGVVYEM